MEELVKPERYIGLTINRIRKIYMLTFIFSVTAYRILMYRMLGLKLNDMIFNYAFA